MHFLDCQVTEQQKGRQNPSTTVSDKINGNTNSPSSSTGIYTANDFASMKQLVVTQDYSGKSLDDLYVCVGDIVHMSLSEQNDDQWLWVHSLKLNSSGYIPSGVVKDLDTVEKANV